MQETGFEADQVATAGSRPFSSYGVLRRGVPAVSVTIAKRVRRPQPPGRVQVKGLPHVTTPVGNVQLVWTHSSKDQQLAERTLMAQTSAKSRFEADTSYPIEALLYGTVLRTANAVAGFVHMPEMRAADSVRASRGH